MSKIGPKNENEGYYHPAVIERRIRLQNEINNQKLIIDYSVFKKTPEERYILKKMKKEWKKNQLLTDLK